MKLEEREEEKRKKVLDPAVPVVEEGVTRVEAEEGIPAFQVLVSGNLSRFGRCIWLDQEDRCSTYRMAAFDHSVLSRVTVSRSYTPFQYFEAVEKAGEMIDEAEILALPSINRMFEDGQLRDKERDDLFSAVLEMLEDYSERVKIIVSTSDRVQGLKEGKVRNLTENSIKAESTGQGFVFRSEDFQQTAYRRETKIQTTLNYSFGTGGDTVGKNKRHLQEPPRKVL